MNYPFTGRRAGKTKTAREAFERAKAAGEHAHYYGLTGAECSINCGASHRGPLEVIK